MTPKTAVVFTPMTDGQRAAAKAWPDARLLFLVGPAGTGKTHAALGLALREHAAGRGLLLSRPQVPLDDEEMGFLPGDVDDKFLPWLGPFADVLGQMSHAKLADLRGLELLPIQFLRGRTIRKATLIIDEAQNLTPSQIVCAATRVGDGGRVVLCGDPQQSDRYKAGESPILGAAARLAQVSGVAVVRFGMADVIRSGFVYDVMQALRPREA